MPPVAEVEAPLTVPGMVDSAAATTDDARSAAPAQPGTGAPSRARVTRVRASVPPVGGRPSSSTAPASPPAPSDEVLASAVQALQTANDRQRALKVRLRPPTGGRRPAAQQSAGEQPAAEEPTRDQPVDEPVEPPPGQQATTTSQAPAVGQAEAPAPAPVETPAVQPEEPSSGTAGSEQVAAAGQRQVGRGAAEEVGKGADRPAAEGGDPPAACTSAGDAWTDGELGAVRDELRGQAVHLRGEIDDAESAAAALQRAAAGESSGDDADAGAKTFEREHEISLANNSRGLLTQVERALSRIEDGSYGHCESCGKAIPKPRLQAFPRATLCVSCKQREERR